MGGGGWEEKEGAEGLGAPGRGGEGAGRLSQRQLETTPAPPS